MQACPDCASCLKFFKLDGRYDVICSGSLLGINLESYDSVHYLEDEDRYFGLGCVQGVVVVATSWNSVSNSFNFFAVRLNLYRF